jgi:hypothetical protein
MAKLSPQLSTDVSKTSVLEINRGATLFRESGSVEPAA